MSSEVASFLEEPQIEDFRKFKKTELLELGQHYKLTVSSSQTKTEIRKIVLAHLVDEEIFSEELLEVSADPGLELKRLEFQERDKAIQLKLKELEI